MNPNGYRLPVEIAINGIPEVNLCFQSNADQEFVLTPFIIDTGSFRSSLNLEMLEMEGLAGFIEPCADDRFEGTIKMEILSHEGVILMDMFQFWVWKKSPFNVLGMDFLTSTCSVLDLNPARQESLWLYREPKSFNGDYKQMYTDIDINGITTNAVLDTGLSTIGSWQPKRAQELQLKEERLSEPITSLTLTGEYENHSVVRDMSVKGFGKQEKGLCLLKTIGIDLGIGMPFLSGATLTFFESGDWDLVFPAQPK